MSGQRSIATGIGAVATVLLVWMVNPWVEVPAGLSQIVTVAFWVAAIALVVVLYLDARKDPDSDQVEIEGPGFTRFLFGNSRAGLFWLPIRLFLGFAWLEAGWHKFTGTGWMDGGEALKGFWTNAVAVPEQGHAAITYDWYRTFLQTLLDNEAYTWFAPLIVFGEMAVGIALLAGILTGFAAFFGSFMNLSFMLAGSASTNPVMFTLAVGVMLAWKVAGYYGVDRWLLPLLGTPWRKKPAAEVQATSAPPQQVGGTA
jgi:thiosulfate dehydrogenase (quinone) large subunit